MWRRVGHGVIKPLILVGVRLREMVMVVVGTW
jgi:hypothetical protein